MADGLLLGLIAIALLRVGEENTQEPEHVHIPPLSTGAKTASDHPPRPNLAILTLVQVSFNIIYRHGMRSCTFQNQLNGWLIDCLVFYTVSAVCQPFTSATLFLSNKVFLVALRSRLSP